MRQVFSSPRLENVERVAQLLRDDGIAVKVTQRRAYKGGLRGNFSYRDDTRTEPMPAVWVVRSEDQPRARAMLRELGLLDSTRSDTGYRLPAFRSEEPAAADDPGRKPQRIGRYDEVVRASSSRPASISSSRARL